MSIHLGDSLAGGMQPKPRFLSEGMMRLIAEPERDHVDEL
jgi:hypothetical protein